MCAGLCWRLEEGEGERGDSRASQLKVGLKISDVCEHPQLPFVHNKGEPLLSDWWLAPTPLSPQTEELFWSSGQFLKIFRAKW